MNVLVTGHSGFIGGWVANFFANKGHHVYGVSRAIRMDCSYNQYPMDITDFQQLNKLVREKCVDVIVHTAGKPLVFDCAQDPYGAYNSNGLGAAAVFEAARVNNIKRVVAIETDKVYGIQKALPTNEYASLNPGSPYEFSKVLAANFAQWYRKNGTDVISVRPVNVFGPGDWSTSRIIPNAMKALINNKGIPLHDNALLMKRDFIYAGDVAHMIYALATDERPKHPIYNLSANDPMTMLEVADRITKVLGLEHIDHELIPKPGKYQEIPQQEIDGSRFFEEFQFVPTTFEEAIKMTWNGYREEING